MQQMTATNVYIELAENVLIGLLSDVNSRAGSFRVNGSLVRMNADPRFPSDLLDMGGGRISIYELFQC